MGILLAKALQELHDAGFVHCDIKPDNITFDFGDDGEARVAHIIDLGLTLRAGRTHCMGASARKRTWYCNCFFDETPVTPKCDVLGLGGVLQFLVDQMRQEYDVLETVVAMACKPKDEDRPSVMQVHDMLVEVLEGVEEEEAARSW